MTDYGLRTMRSLEEQPSGDGGVSALDEWYRSIRDVRLGDLSIADVARSCRQNLFSDFIVPVAIGHLRENPLAGDLYDGELLVSLRSIDADFWRRREDMRIELSKILLHIDKKNLQEEMIADIAVIQKAANIT